MFKINKLNYNTSNTVYEHIAKDHGKQYLYQTKNKQTMANNYGNA